MRCTGCGEFEPTESQEKRRWWRCIDCRSAVNRRNRCKMTSEAIKRRDARNRTDLAWRDKIAARSTVSSAILKGIISKQPRSQCGTPRAEAHHRDYTEPLEVEWLCRSCHRRQHNLPREAGPFSAQAKEARRALERARSKRRWRDPEERRKKSARQSLQKAVAASKISRQPCARCGRFEVEAHHSDYSKPLVVTWLCILCHHAEHQSSPRPPLGKRSLLDGTDREPVGNPA